MAVQIKGAGGGSSLKVPNGKLVEPLANGAVRSGALIETSLGIRDAVTYKSTTGALSRAGKSNCMKIPESSYFVGVESTTADGTFIVIYDDNLNILSSTMITTGANGGECLIEQIDTNTFAILTPLAYSSTTISYVSIVKIEGLTVTYISSTKQQIVTPSDGYDSNAVINKSGAMYCTGKNAFVVSCNKGIFYFKYDDTAQTLTKISSVSYTSGFGFGQTIRSHGNGIYSISGLKNGSTSYNYLTTFTLIDDTLTLIARNTVFSDSNNTMGSCIELEPNILMFSMSYYYRSSSKSRPTGYTLINVAQINTDGTVTVIGETSKYMIDSEYNCGITYGTLLKIFDKIYLCGWFYTDSSANYDYVAVEVYWSHDVVTYGKHGTLDKKTNTFLDSASSGYLSYLSPCIEYNGYMLLSPSQSTISLIDVCDLIMKESDTILTHGIAIKNTASGNKGQAYVVN